MHTAERLVMQIVINTQLSISKARQKISSIFQVFFKKKFQVNFSGCFSCIQAIYELSVIDHVHDQLQSMPIAVPSMIRPTY